MAKTLLFSRLLQLAAAYHDAQRAGEPDLSKALLRGRERGRREFLSLGALSVMGLALDACNAPPPEPRDPDKTTDAETVRVAIVGAGLAGLHCAYRLKLEGVKASVYEASSRVGGRVFSDRESFGSQVAELGGEFIDSNHTTLHTLAEELDIKLDDREADLGADTTREVWWFENAAVPETTVVSQFTAVAPLMAELIDRIEEQGDDALFEELDGISIDAWLKQNVPLEQYPELHKILQSAYRGEYGLETDQQSSLNLLYLIGHDDPDPFRVFGVSDERYHTHSGNQTFAEKLAAELAAQIETGNKLTRVSGPKGGPYRLTLEREAGVLEVEVDHVVFALPFTLLRQVELEDLALSQDKIEMIQELGYGTNAKRIGAFTSRVWRVDHNASGSVTTDQAFQQTWDTSNGQAGEQGILTNFLGGEVGANSDEGSAESGYLSCVEALEGVFPGLAAAYRANSAVRMHWPSHPQTLGSYACYKPGQWRFWSLEGERIGKMHFCGEHTSLDFQGYMEGAAETGARAAAEILKDLGIVPARTLQGLIALRQGLPTRSPSGVPLVRARWRTLRARLAAKLLT
jgi:monoamine oxidase